ncbi:hypothetical protein NBT05_11485 [Aquimarina sp. ERC-38]|uniref:hypothetical protein n=1 Tax=Aquimarina sp. ERC-38 TaxID=2949996 RepID=UPI002245B2AE|nr:hypothetical protein [Aquimarina sp. ERC-38]UZO79578.1 hypothetical protein NBT05_11485 [Aquimarina sp. ERC-38]
MEATLDMPNETSTDQKINLIEGGFTAQEAAYIVNSVLNVKINFHKLNRLSITEGNSADKCEEDNGRIEELLEAQAKAREFFTQARVNDKKVKVNATIHISIED